MSAANTQFSIAVHLLVVLGYSGEERTSAQLAESINTSPSFVRRTLSKLAKAGLVRTSTGKRGACALQKSGAKITMLHIYRAVGSPKVFSIHDYPEQKNCDVSCNIKCSMTKVLIKIQRSVEQALAKITLAQVVADLKT